MRVIAQFKGTNEQFQEYLKNVLMPQALVELELQARADLFIETIRLS